jgi:hypothetical protein
LATVIYGGKSEEVLSAHAAVMVAADRLALAAFDLGVSTAWMEPVDRDAERARLEASHAD